jgi:regulatory protein
VTSGPEAVRRRDPSPAADGSRPDPVMERAGRLLSIRPHSTLELREKLMSAGFAEPEVEATLERLTELKIVDDASFARSLAESRNRHGSRSAAAIAAELEAKGVDPDLSQEALAEIDDLATARQLAVDQASVMGHLPFEAQARRIYGQLARRGFEEETIQEALKAVLPPEGWD